MIPQKPAPSDADAQTPAQRAERLRRLKQRYGKRPVPPAVLARNGLPSAAGKGQPKRHGQGKEAT